MEQSNTKERKVINLDDGKSREQVQKMARLAASSKLSPREWGVQLSAAKAARRNDRLLRADENNRGGLKEYTVELGIESELGDVELSNIRDKMDGFDVDQDK